MRTETESNRQRHTGIKWQKYTKRYTDKQNETVGDKDRLTDTDRLTDRDSLTDRDRLTNRDRQRPATNRQTDSDS